jgi:hypothetical protein
MASILKAGEVVPCELDSDGQPRLPHVRKIETGPTDAERAEAYRTEIGARLGQICDMMTEAKQKHGLMIAFQIAGPDAFSRFSIGVLDVMKKLA